jgi:hypothetical protein
MKSYLEIIIDKKLMPKYIGFRDYHRYLYGKNKIVSLNFSVITTSFKLVTNKTFMLIII